MRSVKLHNAKSIRFRRWSRAGYAIFCSLACSVTIGCVANSISDKSLQKAVGTSSAVLCVVGASYDDSEEKENAELEATLQQVQETTFIQTTVDSAAACGQTSLYIFIHHSG